MRSGYKQTDVGVIPEPWEVAVVGDLATFASGRGVRVSQLRPHSSDCSVPVFGGNGLAGYTDTPLVREPTVVIGRVGQKCGEVYLTEGPAWITDNALYPKRLSRKFDLQFFALALEAAKLNDVKNRNDLPLLTQAILHAMPMAWAPDPAEQRAIAAALGDVDSLLATLDAALTKKRNLKHAAMQQLLTSQSRLPGFSKAWQVSSVGREFDIQLGKMLDAARNVGIEKPYLGNKAVQWNRIDLSALALMRMSRTDMERYRLRKGDLLVCEGGEVGRAAIWDAPIDECYYQKALHRLRPLRGFVPRLMAMFLQYWTTQGLLADSVTQTSIAHLTREKLAEVPVPVPGPDEQAAIVSVLSDMDAEIAALDARRDKIHMLKQAMMQELLTGRTRLV